MSECKHCGSEIDDGAQLLQWLRERYDAATERQANAKTERGRTRATNEAQTLDGFIVWVDDKVRSDER